jgi:hypothetical protein
LAQAGLGHPSVPSPSPPWAREVVMQYRRENPYNSEAIGPTLPRSTSSSSPPPNQQAPHQQAPRSLVPHSTRPPLQPPMTSSIPGRWPSTAAVLPNSMTTSPRPNSGTTPSARAGRARNGTSSCGNSRRRPGSAGAHDAWAQNPSEPG